MKEPALGSRTNVLVAGTQAQRVPAMRSHSCSWMQECVSYPLFYSKSKLGETHVA